MKSRLSRIENNIIKFSPKWTKAYQNWIKKGKPNQFTAYLLHDKKLKVKKLGISSLVSDVKILVVIDALAIQVVCVKNVSRGK